MDVYELMTAFEEHLECNYAEMCISLDDLEEERRLYSYDDMNFQYITTSNLEKFLTKHGWTIES